MDGGTSGAVILNPTVLISASEAKRKLKKLTVAETSRDGILAVLLTPDKSVSVKVSLKVTATLDGREATVKTEHQEGKSQWYKVAVGSGKHAITLTVNPSIEGMAWKGKATVWFVSRQKQNLGELVLTLKEAPAERILPPTAWPAGEVRRNVKIGQAAIAVGTTR